MTELSVQLVELVSKTKRDLEGLSEPEASLVRGDDGWSRKQILGHLIDSASNNHLRFVRALLQPEVRMPGYDQDGCVRVERFQELPWTQLMDFWATYNHFLAHVIAGFPKDKLGTVCAIGDSAAMTLQELADDYVRHMQHHLAQIKS